MHENKALSRDRIVVRTSIIGILTNILLAIFKAVVGVLSHSIAITLDAINNLSDALSSVITIIGTKLAGKEPDRKHPYGYGRIEYLSTTIIAMIVLYAGITSFMEAVKKIIHPQAANYSTVTLLIVAVSVAVKIILGLYVKKTGEQVHSDSLVASGSDAMLDSVISASTLIAAGIFIACRISLEAWLGAIISLVIIKSGCEMLTETLSKILGERFDGDLGRQIKKAITQIDGVEGAYDLVLHDYGPDKYLGSVHIEVPDTYTAARIDGITRQIQNLIYQEYNVIMVAVGIYSINTKADELASIRDKIRQIVLSHDHVLQMHGFYINPDKKYISLDVVIDYTAPDRKALYAHIVDEIKEHFPGYTYTINMDDYISD